MARKLLNLTGESFGQLLVLREAPQRKYNRRWVCRCSCGNVIETSQSSLRDGKSKSCGCTAIERMSAIKIIDLVGLEFGRLTVLAKADRGSHRQWFWLCRCVCGKEVTVRGNSLASGNSTSCGCSLIVHGLSGTKPYKRFHAAKRIAAQLQRTPRWSDLEAIKRIYKQVPDGYDVDHIVPLQGVNVSGLHVPNNLQYLSKSDNSSKSNRFTSEIVFPHEPSHLPNVYWG